MALLSVGWRLLLQFLRMLIVWTLASIQEGGFIVVVGWKAGFTDKYNDNKYRW